MKISGLYFSFFILLIFLLMLNGCSFFRPLEEKPAAVVTPEGTPQTPAKQPVQTIIAQKEFPEGDMGVRLSEIQFELKRIQSEISHLNSEITNLKARSDMWRNPQEIFSKKVILSNGTTFTGNVVYQDEEVVKIETLLGTLVLKRDYITRIVENVPESSGFMEVKPETMTRETPGVVKETRGEFRTTKAGGVYQANCVLEGVIQEKKDKSGNTIFRGVIKNVGNRRADFVKVNFIIRKDWSGNTKTFTTFVDGSQYTFSSGITTDTSLPPGASGGFEIYIPRSVGPFIGYSYSIDWEEYD